MTKNGYFGKILWINLSEDTFREEDSGFRGHWSDEL